MSKKILVGFIAVMLVIGTFTLGAQTASAQGISISQLIELLINIGVISPDKVTAARSFVANQNTTGTQYRTGTQDGAYITASAVSKTITTSGYPQNSGTGSNISTSSLAATFYIRIKAVGGSIIMNSASMGSAFKFERYVNGTKVSPDAVPYVVDYSIPAGVVTSGLNGAFMIPEGVEVTIPVVYVIQGRFPNGQVINPGGLTSVGVESISYRTVDTGSHIDNSMSGNVDWRTSNVSFEGTTKITKYHSADTNQDWKITDTELARVTELYNYKSGISRTGQYHSQAGTVDGYAQGPGNIITYHSADYYKDGMISLVELSRVIELKNAGGYKIEYGTEDGFAPAAPSLITCSLKSDKSSYSLGETIVFSWTSPNARYAYWQQDNSGKDYLNLPGDKFNGNDSTKVIASVIGNPKVILIVGGTTGTGSCSTTINIVNTNTADIPYIKVSYPQAGNSLDNSGAKDSGIIGYVQWTSANTNSLPIEIDLLNSSGTIIKNIAQYLSNTGTYAWKYDPSISNGTYKILVTTQAKEGTIGMAAGQSGLFNLSGNNPPVGVPLSASCTGTPIGSTITWYASAVGGSGTYTYAWSIYNDVVGYPAGSTSSSKVTTTYGSSGTKQANIRINDNAGSTAYASCSGIIETVESSVISPSLSTYSWVASDANTWPIISTPSKLGPNQAMKIKDLGGIQYFEKNLGVNKAKITSSPAVGVTQLQVYIYDYLTGVITASKDINVTITYPDNQGEMEFNGYQINRAGTSNMGSSLVSIESINQLIQILK
jgi:hypothetical protein